MLASHIESVRAAAQELKDSQKALEKAETEFNEAQQRAFEAQRNFGRAQRALMEYVTSGAE